MATITQLGKAALLGSACLVLAACSQADGDGTAEAATTDEAVSVLAHMHMTSTDAMREAMKASFDEGQMAMLESVGHQIAVAQTCEGFDIDEARMQEELNRIHHDENGEPMDITPAELDLRDKKALVGLGMATGSQIAIASYDVEGFCTVAEVERTNEEGDATSHIIWKSSEG